MVKLIGMKKKTFRTRRLKAGLPAPASVVFESAHGDRNKESHAVAAMARAIDKFKQARGRYVAHPGFGVITDDEWTDFHTIHGVHHLSFLTPNKASASLQTAGAEALT